MAISTYAELKTAISNWTDRTDLNDTRLSEFIALAEARIARRLRVRGVETRDTSITLVAGTAYYTLPSDFVEARNIQVNSDPVRVLRYLTPQQMDKMYPYVTNGTPAHYTIIGTEIQIKPTPNSGDTLEIAYFKKLSALSNSNTTNWLTTNAPDLLLYASLIEAELYLVNEEKASSWAKVFDVAMQEWNSQEDKGRHSGSSLASQTDTGTP